MLYCSLTGYPSYVSTSIPAIIWWKKKIYYLFEVFHWFVKTKNLCPYRLQSTFCPKLEVFVTPWVLNMVFKGQTQRETWGQLYSQLSLRETPSRWAPTFQLREVSNLWRSVEIQQNNWKSAHRNSKTEILNLLFWPESSHFWWMFLAPRFCSIFSRFLGTLLSQRKKDVFRVTSLFSMILCYFSVASQPFFHL